VPRLAAPLLVALLAARPAAAVDVRVLLYWNDDGGTCCETSIIGCLDASNSGGYVPGVRFVVDTASRINGSTLSGHDVLIMPGSASAADYTRSGYVDGSAVKSFVRGGEGYVGICAGGYAAVDDEGRWGLAPGVHRRATTFGGTLPVGMTAAGTAVLGYSGTVTLRHEHGLAMYRSEGSTATPWATYADDSTGYRGYIAILGATYGSGRTVLSGPHPELAPRRCDMLARMVAWAASVTGCTPVAETCNNRDDDCDGAVDEGLSRNCGTDVGECEFGTETCAAGAWGACLGAVWPVPEVCDDLDNDCDAASDDDWVCEIDEVMYVSAAIAGGGSTDIDGDGRADACARAAGSFRCHLASGHGFESLVLGPDLSDENGWDAPAYGSTLRLGDVDGDGRADLCARAASGVVCWRSTGVGFGERLPGPPLSDADGWNVPERFSTIRLGDIDADGRQDLCARDAGGVACWRSTGVGFGERLPGPPLSDAAGWTAVFRYGTIRTGDVDGDGRQDLCARDAGGVRCWLASGHGFDTLVAGPEWSDAGGWDAFEYWSTIRLTDIDGDGRADLCARGAGGFRCHLSEGVGFSAPIAGPDLSDGAAWSRRDRFPSLRTGDIDGDGTTDVCARGAEGVLCWLWTGQGFGRRIAGPALTDANGWSARPYLRTLRLADVTGDGRADFCARASDGLWCWPSDGEGFPTVIRGPEWSDAGGWNDPRYYASIRIDDGAPAGSGGGPGSGSGGCSAAGPASGGWGALAGLALAAAWRARRRLDILPDVRHNTRGQGGAGCATLSRRSRRGEGGDGRWRRA
jgi:hypothetical protein